MKKYLFILLLFSSCEVYDISPEENLLTGWRNLANTFDTFDTLGVDILAKDMGESIYLSMIESNLISPVFIGDKFLFEYRLKTEGIAPSVKIFDCCGSGAMSDIVQLKEGKHRIFLEVKSSSEFDAAFFHITTPPEEYASFLLSDMFLKKVD